MSLSVVREAVTRLASEDLVEATPQRGFRVRPLSVEHLQDLTWVRVQLETLALRESIAKGDVTWEANLVAAHHRLAVTPTYFEDGTGNLEWLTAHSGFHAALAAAAGSPILERLRRQLYDAAELYRMWSSNLPQHPTREHVDDEHRAIFEAALARDADRAVELVTRHLETHRAPPRSDRTRRQSGVMSISGARPRAPSSPGSLAVARSTGPAVPA